MTRFPIRWDSLAMSMQGTLMLPGAPHYETARRVWNARIDRRPAAIAACASKSDVEAAVLFAAETGIKISVRGGGHSIGGLCLDDDTLLVDLGGMRTVDVDARHRRARVAGGARWRDLDAVAGAFGLATTGGMISTTGIGGLTLGGGIGWLARKYGLASDNLLGLEVVLANGECVRVTDDSYADLFGVLRGGGTRLGVVTEFAFKLHPVSTVLAGSLWCKGERAVDVLRIFREFSTCIPDELTMLATATLAPMAEFVPSALQGKPMVVIGCCWCGEQRVGERVLEPLRSRLRAEVDLITVLPYPTWQSSLDATAPFGMRNHWESACLPALDDATIDRIAAHCFELPTPMSRIHVHHLQGSVSQPRGDAADAVRPHPFIVKVVATWPAAWNDATTIDWARGCCEELSAGYRRLAYVNFSGADADDRAPALAPELLERLGQAKRRYDPGAMFV